MRGRRWSRRASAHGQAGRSSSVRCRHRRPAATTGLPVPPRPRLCRALRLGPRGSAHERPGAPRRRFGASSSVRSTNRPRGTGRRTSCAVAKTPSLRFDGITRGVARSALSSAVRHESTSLARWTDASRVERVAFVRDRVARCERQAPRRPSRARSVRRGRDRVAARRAGELGLLSRRPRPSCRVRRRGSYASGSVDLEPAPGRGPLPHPDLEPC